MPCITKSDASLTSMVVKLRVSRVIQWGIFLTTCVLLVFHFATGNEKQARQLQRAEVFKHSRSANSTEIRPRLKDAYEKKILSEDEYYGELAHMLAVTVDDPAGIIREIVESKNKYGFEVMVGNLAGNEIAVVGMSREDRDEVIDLIKSNKPAWSGFIHEFGLSDVYRYENWLNALRSMYATEGDFYQFLDDLILNQITDPREVFGIRHAMQGDDSLKNISEKSREKYLHYIHQYDTDYPSNEVSPYINGAGQ